MAKIEFADENISTDVPEGTTIQDVCEQTGSSHEFGCRDGVCGTCIITVAEGMDAVSPMAEEEADTLEAFDAGKNDRLACQMVVTGGSDAHIVFRNRED